VFQANRKTTCGGQRDQEALKYFTALDKPQIDAICALRHAFAHDYGLYNKPDDPQNAGSSVPICSITLLSALEVGPLLRFRKSGRALKQTSIR
jgi:hypothetical protein